MRNGTKMNPRTPGRPRQYDPDKALSAALLEFRKRGYAATSLDNLVEITGMNRPSLYSAFGSKKEIFLKAIDHFRTTVLGNHRVILFGSGSLRDCLVAYFDALIASYNIKAGNLGCPLLCNINGEAVSDPDFRSALSDGLAGMDAMFIERLQQAQKNDELPPALPPKVLGPMLGSLQHSIAIRSRSGATTKELRSYTRNAIELLLR